MFQSIQQLANIEEIDEEKGAQFVFPDHERKLLRRLGVILVVGRRNSCSC